MARRRKKPLSARAWILMFTGVALALVFSSTTVILFFGMMPAVGAFMVDRTQKKSQALSVTAMNLAGCSPFVLKLWTSGNPSSVDYALEIIGQAKTIVIIYLLAMSGYAISMAVTGVVSAFLLQRGQKRVEVIAKKQEGLEDRWGIEVSGKCEVDEHGFAVSSANKF